MKKALIVLSAIALLGCSHATKKQSAEAENILPKDTIEIINSDSINNTDTLNIDSVEYKILSVKKRHKFEDFPAEIYDKKLSPPDFSNNSFASDKEYVDFITEGCEKQGINFGGHFTILGKSCGACCSFVFMVDRQNGHVLDIKANGFDEEDGAYGYTYQKDSKLLIANSSLFIDDKYEKYCNFMNSGLEPKFYIWKNNKFILLKYCRCVNI
jgi:hypothetical protein